MCVLSYPRQIFPCQSRIDESTHNAAQAAAFPIIPPSSRGHRSSEIFVGANTFVCLPFPRTGSVHGDKDGPDTRIGRACPQQIGGHFAISVYVELEEEVRRRSRVRNVLHRVGG